MISNHNELTLTDLIDIDFLQRFQDKFASVLKIASIIVDNKGSVTEGSNFTDFCYKCTRQSELGLKRCINCDIVNGKLAAKRGEPVIYRCHTGLTDFAVPIIVEGKHVGSILGGQVLTEEPDEEHFRAVARDLGINEDEYIQAVKKINIVPFEYVKMAADFLFVVGNAISEIGQKKLKIIEKNKREVLYRTIMEMIRNSLDIAETKKRIVDILGRTLHADRCLIMEYNKETDKFLNISEEYVSSEDVIPYSGVDLNSHIPNAVAEFKKGKILLYNKDGMQLNPNTPEVEILTFQEEKAAIEKYKITSALIYPLYYQEEFLGDLVLHYVDSSHEIEEEEISLVGIIVKQISIALHQAKLYEKTKLQAESEKFSKSIIEILRSTLDKNLIKSLFVKITGKYFKADRVLLSEYDKNQRRYLPVDVYSEYLSGPDVKSFIGIDWMETGASEFIDVLLDRKELKFPDFDKYIEQHPKSKEFIELFDGSVAKSTYTFPILYQQEIMGYFSLGFINEAKNLEEDDINKIRIICSQAGIALYQAKLYLDAQESARLCEQKIKERFLQIEPNLLSIRQLIDFLSRSDMSSNESQSYIENIREEADDLIGLIATIKNQ